MPAYITLDRFKMLTTIPVAFIDAIESVQPGFTDAQLEYWSRRIDAQLAKRYAVPFIAPVSIAVEGWLARVVTPGVWSKRGVDPEDKQWQEVVADRDAALAEIKEAANAETGLYDLPLREVTEPESGISRGFPRGYSETSPYVWMGEQQKRGSSEDESGGGTFT